MGTSHAPIHEYTLFFLKKVLFVTVLKLVCLKQRPKDSGLFQHVQT